VILWQGYGMTETCGIISFEFPTNGKARRFGSTGVLATGVEGKVVDVETLKHLPPNQLGEICVRGPHIMQGENLVLVPCVMRSNSHASFA
jgi:4-coumarate--CoA ligase